MNSNSTLQVATSSEMHTVGRIGGDGATSVVHPRLFAHLNGKKEQLV